MYSKVLAKFWRIKINKMCLQYYNIFLILVVQIVTSTSLYTFSMLLCFVHAETAFLNDDIYKYTSLYMVYTYTMKYNRNQNYVPD
jgi:hypothetical protein